MDFQQAALATCGLVVTYVWYKLYRALTISDVPGPKNPSWIYGMRPHVTYAYAALLFFYISPVPGTGHLWWWQLEEARVVEKNLLGKYGTVVRWNGPLGVSFVSGRRCYPYLLLPFRKTDCGSLIQRPSTTSSKAQAICTRNRMPSGNDSQ